MIMYAKFIYGVWKASVVDQMREDLEKFNEMRKEKEKEKVKVG